MARDFPFIASKEIRSPLVRNVEATNSRTSPEIQLADVFMGAVGYAWEGFQTSEPKLTLIRYIEETFGLKLDMPTPYLSEKINIWKFRLHDKTKSAPRPTPRRGQVYTMYTVRRAVALLLNHYTIKYDVKQGGVENYGRAKDSSHH